jgi:hypothetical protein
VAINLGTSGAGRVVDMVLFDCLAFLAYISIHFFDPLCRALCAALKTLMYVHDSLALSAFGISCEYSVARVIIWNSGIPEGK